MIELLEYTFFWHAVVGCVLTGIVCGLIGTYVVSRRMVFIAGGLAHASLGGVGVCALFGWSPLLGASLFGLLAACGVYGLSRHREVRGDSAIAMLWAFGMSLGIICLFLSPKYLPSLSSYLFGNILYATNEDLSFIAIVTAVVICFFALRLPQIVAISFDTTFARSSRLRVGIFEQVMLLLTALCIVASLRTVGIVMVIALMSVPQAVASLYMGSFRGVALGSVAVGVVSCLSGLWASYVLNIPSGPAIIMVCIAIYAIARAIKIFSARLNKI